MKLNEALDHLSESVKDTLAYFNELDPSDVPTLLKAFALLKDNKEILSSLEEIISKQYKQLAEQVIPDVFKANSFDSLKTAGRNFILSTRVMANIPEDQREFAFEWIKSTAGVPELIKPTVNSKTLSSFVTQYFEAHGQWPPEEAIKVHKQDYIQVRKA